MANPIKIIKNGIINENADISGQSGALVSYSGGYIFRYQWYRHGPFHNSSTDFCEPVYLSAEKGNPRYSTYPLLYRCYCYIRNNHRVPAEGLSACTERIPGSVHSTDRSKLSDSGACRSIRFQKWSRCFRIRWYRYGSWFHHRSGLSGSGARIHRQRHTVRRNSSARSIP